MGSYAILSPTGMLSPQGPPSGAPNDSTAGATVQGHGAVPCIPKSHPRGDPSDSTASATAQGHGAPLHKPQECPASESLCIASMVSPTGVLTPQCQTSGPSFAPPAMVAPQRCFSTPLFHSLLSIGLPILHVVGGLVGRMKSPALVIDGRGGVVPCPRGANAQVWSVCVR